MFGTDRILNFVSVLSNHNKKRVSSGTLQEANRVKFFMKTAALTHIHYEVMLVRVRHTQ